MPSNWRWKRNDTNPISGTIKEKTATGRTAVDIQSASVRFHMRNKALTETVVDAAANNDQVGDGSDGTKGDWSYDPVAADTDASGSFWGEVEVTFADSTIRTFPTTGFFEVLIGDDLL